MNLVRITAASLLVMAGCAHRAPAIRASVPASTTTESAQPPSFLLGDFLDDYGSRFTLSATEFFQRPRNRYHILQWNPREQYFIAQNDAANPSAPNRFTRVDWMILSGMAPYRWAFCFSAYEAATAAEAERSAIANRSMPQTGCNKFPFTRMQPALF